MVQHTNNLTSNSTLLVRNCINMDMNKLGTSQGLIVSGANTNDDSGRTVSRIGDINGDGYEDVIIYASGASPNGKEQAAESYVIFGKPEASANINLATLDNTQGFKILGAYDFTNCYGNTCVSGAGDVNGDGFDDIVITSPSATGAGHIFIVLGKNSSFNYIDLALLNSTQGSIITGISYGYYSVSSAGDVNNDGFDDIIIGDTSFSRVFLLFGGKTLFQNINLGQLQPNQGFAIFGKYNDHIGNAVNSAGDINKDGFADIIIGAQQASPEGKQSAGSVYVIFGKASSFETLYLDNIKAEEGFTVLGDKAGDRCGYSVNTAGDINRDGYSDIIIGSPSFSYNGVLGIGACYIIYGNGLGFKNISLANLTHTQGSVILGARSFSYIGSSVSSAGDVNGDGYDDVIIGGSQGNNYYRDQAYVILGKNNFTDISLADLSSEQGFNLTAKDYGDFFGNSVSGAFDFNNDGYSDFILGAFAASSNGMPQTGVSYIIYSCEASVPIPSPAPTTSSPTTSPTMPQRLIADVNLTTLNNNQGAVMYGANSYDISGYSVSGIGDFNGDGYDDVMIGAPNANPNEIVLAGVTYVIYGSASGITNTDLQNLTGVTGFKITGADQYGYLGKSVSGAGDINGDGFADIVISAPGTNSYYPNTPGKVYVIFGNRASADINLSNFNSSQGFKISDSGFYSQNVNSAGDINNDGFDDIIFNGYYGFYYYTFLIYGKSTGLSNIILSNLNTQQGFYITSRSNQDQVSGAGDFNKDGFDDFMISAVKDNLWSIYIIFGKNNSINLNLANLDSTQAYKLNVIGQVSLSSAGDINGDNIEDIIIGAPSSIENGRNDGTTYIVYGGNNVSNTSLVNLNITQGIKIFGAKEYDIFGSSVSGRGDINGDGYSDVIIGAKYAGYDDKVQTGITYVLFGNEKPDNIDVSFLNNSIGFQIKGEENTNWSGFSVSNAGDINGDGYDDVMIGAYNADPYDRFKGGKSYIVTDSSAMPSPTAYPTLSALPTINPTIVPTITPTIFAPPTIKPTTTQTLTPTVEPTPMPTADSATTISSDTDDISSAKFWSTWTNTLLIGVSTTLTGAGIYFGTQQTCYYILRHSSLETDYHLSPKSYTPKFIYNLCRKRYLEELKKYDALKNNINTESKDHCINMEEGAANLLENGHISPKQNRGNIVNSIDAMIDPKHRELQNQEFEKFFNNLDLVVNDLKLAIYNFYETILITDGRAKQDQSLVIYQEPIIGSSNGLINPILNIRQMIEYLPIISYLNKNIIYPITQNYLPEYIQNITFSEVLDSKILLFTTHLIAGHLGTAYLPDELIIKGLMVSTAGSTAFGLRLTSSHYLNEYKQELITQEKSMEITEAGKYCVATAFAYTIPALATCALAHAVMPEYQCNSLDLGIKLSFAGSECYSVYKTTQVFQSITTTDVVVPYIMDTTAAIITYVNHHNPMLVIAAVITSDCMSRIVMDLVPVEIKENYIDPGFNYIFDVVQGSVNKISGDINYFFTPGEL